MRQIGLKREKYIAGETLLIKNSFNIYYGPEMALGSRNIIVSRLDGRALWPRGLPTLVEGTWQESHPGVCVKRGQRFL